MVILVYDNSKSCVDTGHEIKFTMRMDILMVDISHVLMLARDEVQDEKRYLGSW